MTDVLLTQDVQLEGWGVAELFDALPGKNGLFTIGDKIQEVRFGNKITDNGDKIYGERLANMGSNAAPTGMQLGTGTTAASKSGAGASIGAYITGSAIAFLAGWPTSTANPGAGHIIQFKTGWGPGVATNTAITEVVLINQPVATDAGAAVGFTIARAKFATSLNKLADKILYVTWNHVVLGA